MAADETISIEVKDGVDKNISRNLSQISTAARSAYQNVDKLVRQLNRIKPTAIAQFNSVVTNAQRQMSAAAMSAEKLATQQQRTAVAAANAATAEQRTAAATANADRAQSAAAASALRLEAAQGRSAAAADRQAAAQSRAAAAAARQSANIARQDVEIARITGINDRYNAVLARNPRYQAAFNRGLANTAKNAGLARYELVNLSYQANDVVMGLATGQRPMQVFLQQGAQIGQIFGGSGAGAGAIFKQLAGIVGRFVARLLPFAAVIGAALLPFSRFTKEINEGLDSSKMIADLKLTETQMKALKESGESTSVTFGDTFKAAFQVIGRHASTYLKPVTDWIVKWWNKALDFIMEALTMFVKVAIGGFIALKNVITTVWSDIPAALELYVKTGANNAISIIEFAMNQISSALTDSPLGKLMGLEGPITITLPRLELSDAAANMETALGDAVRNGMLAGDDIVRQFGEDVRAQAITNAQNRIRAAAGEADEDASKKGGFNRARELAQINAELDSQAKTMFELSYARDAANRAEEIALRFAKEGQPLRQEEITALRNKIQALNDAKEVQQQFDRIYQSVAGPQREYNASLEAARRLLDMGVISQERYAAELVRSEDAYKRATDPLYDMNKELDEQIRLLGMASGAREVEQQVMQAVNAAMQNGQPLRQAEIDDLREKLRLVQQLNIQSQLADQLQANSRAQQSMNRQGMTDAAIGQVGNNGFDNLDVVNQLAQDNPGLQATQEYALAQVAAYQDMYAQINELREADIISETSAMQAKMAIFQEQYKTQIDGAMNALGALASLQNSENKKQAAIGKKAAIAQTIIQTYQSATSAFSSLASIPYVGPILGAAAAAAAIAAGMANVQQIRAQNVGFKDGGYTGNLPTNAIAGPVHGKEYVFDAPSTARIGVGNLEALRRGRVAPETMMRGESTSAPMQSNVSSSNGEVNYNQTVMVTVAGKRDRKTAEQEARAIRRESTRELIRSGG